MPREMKKLLCVSVSDQHKELVLANRRLVPHLLDGLMLDPNQ